MKPKRYLLTAAILGALAVLLGAFGAHGLEDLLHPYRLSIFDTGVHYQFYHTLALFLLGILLGQKKYTHNRLLKDAGYAFMVGIILFSGSLYLLATRDLLGIDDWKWLIGPCTPIGGFCFVIGWILVAVGVWRS